MADQVWWSLATATFRHPRESFGLAYGDRDPRDLQAAWGRPVGLGRIPETPDPPFKFYSILDEGQTPADLVDGSGRRLNQVWNSAGFVFLAHEALALVQSLNLPEARFFDAVLLDHDQSEIREPFKIFVPGASKKSVLDTQSPAFKDGMSGSFHSYVLASALTNDDDIVLNADALAGPEIWFERRVRKALFLSERIAQALEQNGLTEAFALRRAPVMPGS